MPPDRRFGVVVNVEDVRAGDVVCLFHQDDAVVERVDEYDDGQLTVRWRRRARMGEPGDPGRGGDGWYLGSLAPRQRGAAVTLRGRA